MRKQLIAWVASAALMIPAAGMAAGGGVALESANIDVHNHSSLQNGAKYYMNYCVGCHGLQASRYNRMALDMGLPVVPEQTGKAGDEAGQVADANAKLISDNLIFTKDAEGKPTALGSLMKSSIPEADAANWFGAAPPDLSLVGRSRGADWIYTYLKSFYLDSERPTGVNNTVFPNVGMPHVLWELQGFQEMDHDTHALNLTKPGSMSAAEYDKVVRDLTSFLVYVSEPAQLHRTKYGILAMIILVIFTILAYFLKKEFWKDIH